MHFTRRQFLQTAGAAGLALGAAPALALGKPGPRLNRRALVRRHNPVVTRFDPFSALSVGNGEFAFTADVTGLQTFAAACEKEFPLCTMAHWAWHTIPAPAGVRREDFRFKEYDTFGRKVGYATSKTGQEPLFNWLRENPHGLHLGRIALALQKADGSPAAPEDLKNPRQELDLWTGAIDGRFAFEGQPVRVLTCAHPALDAVAVRVESPLLASGRLQVRLAFPYGSPKEATADWSQPEKHASTLTRHGERNATIERALDNDRYTVSLGWSARAALQQPAAHEFLLRGEKAELEFVCAFAPAALPDALPSFANTREAAADHWRQFWEEGGAIDLGGSTDARAEELERRIVLSQYNTALHCAGSLPSQETGLLYNSWYGKFHLEMHWWHSVHFTAWNRFALFERSLGIYERLLPLARATAARQGYRGARWPKMIGPDGLDSPSPVAPLLIWQQPHPVYYAELCYRQNPSRATLDRWFDLVFESAEFMADFAVLDAPHDRFILGPPMKTVSENTDPLAVLNPAFELAYWRFGLRTALAWCDRAGLPRPARWTAVWQKLSPLPQADGIYLMQENLPDTFTKWNYDHPALLGALGMQPGDGVDAPTMRRTVRRVMETWQWDRAWGWDFPLTALAAARTGEPELAVQALLIPSPKNRYHPNGHNYQRENLTAYLPGNGGLLAATALMAAGWTGGPQTDAPGFPQDGKWAVRHENLQRWL
jgi:protein-glucosylgalactosylhydroxylysine glucosidase